MYHTDLLSSISNQFFNSQKYPENRFSCKDIYCRSLCLFHVLEAEGRFCCGPNASYASYASTGPVISPSAVSHVEPEVGSLLLVGIMISKLVQKCARWLLTRLIRYGQDRLYLYKNMCQHISSTISQFQYISSNCASVTLLLLLESEVYDF